MKILLVCLSAVYIGAVLHLLWVAGNKWHRYTLAKATCSILFVLIAVMGAFWGTQNHRLDIGLLIGALLFCMLGDILLGRANHGKVLRWMPFSVGAVSFALAHVVFCVLFYCIAPFLWYDLPLPAALVAVLYLLERKKRIHLGKMRPLGYIYAGIVGLMFAKAAQMPWNAAWSMPAPFLVAAGGALFLVSDIFLLFLYFSSRKRKRVRYYNLSTYYAGVYLLALSAWWM